MPSYTYTSNVSPKDRFTRLEMLLDNGDVGVIVQGRSYSLTLSEVSRASQFVVLISTDEISERPYVIDHLPIVGIPQDGDVPVWSEAASAFVLDSGLRTPPLRFEQGVATLTASRAHHVSGGPVHYTRSRITVDDAVPGSVNLVSVKRNGAVVATLGLSTGQTTATDDISITASDSDAIVVTRLNTSGGGLVLELDGG